MMYVCVYVYVYVYVYGVMMMMVSWMIIIIIILITELLETVNVLIFHGRYCVIRLACFLGRLMIGAEGVLGVWVGCSFFILYVWHVYGIGLFEIRKYIKIRE